MRNTLDAILAKKKMISERIDALSWTAAQESLPRMGYARLGSILKQEECERSKSLYAKPELFRKRIEMERFRFGKGQYQYFQYPLPGLVAELRVALFRHLVKLANDWMAALCLPETYPDSLGGFLQRCHSVGQTQPTPLLLRYRAGDFNCLHQDIYGELAFPFQVVCCLSRPGDEFTGGEFLLVEQRPRAQSIGHALRLEQGEAIVIATRYKPVKGLNGYYRGNVRHGVSPILSGERFSLGIIFHDAS